MFSGLEKGCIGNKWVKCLGKIRDLGAVVSNECERSKSNLLVFRNILTKEISIEEESLIIKHAGYSLMFL